jgi:hypothetical protein
MNDVSGNGAGQRSVIGIGGTKTANRKSSIVSVEKTASTPSCHPFASFNHANNVSTSTQCASTPKTLSDARVNSSVNSNVNVNDNVHVHGNISDNCNRNDSDKGNDNGKGNCNGNGKGNGSTPECATDKVTNAEKQESNLSNFSDVLTAADGKIDIDAVFANFLKQMEKQLQGKKHFHDYCVSF